MFFEYVLIDQFQDIEMIKDFKQIEKSNLKKITKIFALYITHYDL